MTYEELIEGLEQRGFVDTDGIGSKGRCNKDEKHFILLTDGLVIYSDIPFYNHTEHHPGSKCDIWAAENYSDEYYTDATPIFTWEALDKYLEQDTDEGPGIYPPACSRCNAICSYIELLETDPEIQAKRIDGKFVCANCLKP